MAKGCRSCCFSDVDQTSHARSEPRKVRVKESDIRIYCTPVIAISSRGHTVCTSKSVQSTVTNALKPLCVCLQRRHFRCKPTAKRPKSVVRNALPKRRVRCIDRRKMTVGGFDVQAGSVQAWKALIPAPRLRIRVVLLIFDA